MGLGTKIRSGDFKPIFKKTGEEIQKALTNFSFLRKEIEQGTLIRFGEPESEKLYQNSEELVAHLKDALGEAKKIKKTIKKSVI
jgi:hypothetical protein